MIGKISKKMVLIAVGSMLLGFVIGLAFSHPEKPHNKVLLQKSDLRYLQEHGANNPEWKEIKHEAGQDVLTIELKQPKRTIVVKIK